MFEVFRWNICVCTENGFLCKESPYAADYHLNCTELVWTQAKLHDTSEKLISLLIIYSGFSYHIFLYRCRMTLSLSNANKWFSLILYRWLCREKPPCNVWQKKGEGQVNFPINFVIIWVTFGHFILYCRDQTSRSNWEKIITKVFGVLIGHNMKLYPVLGIISVRKV